MALKEINWQNPDDGVSVEWRDVETAMVRLYVEPYDDQWRIIEFTKDWVPMVYKGKYFPTSEEAVRYAKTFHPLLHKFVPSVPDGRSCLICGWDEHRHLLKGYE